MEEAIYRFDGRSYLPTDLARGPWSPEFQHGGPPSALLAGAVEQLTPPNMFVARTTTELLRPVPLLPLQVQTDVIRPGKRVQLIGATLIAAGDEIARMTALRIRQSVEETPTVPLHDTSPPPAPETGTEQPAFALHHQHFFAHALEVRYVEGTGTEPGPTTAWIRLRVPLVEGMATSPLQRVMVAADCGNGVSWEIDFETHVFINPDLTVYLHRLPASEWVCLEAVTDLGAGTGLAQSGLYDEHGSIGRSLQALYVDRR